jgi:2-polyprenyl-3-methyl-5-hydroxy-6-metoxy-1,4-benzoquinol methylase
VKIELADGRIVEYQLRLGTEEASVKEITQQFNRFNYTLQVDDKSVEGRGSRGDYCVWLPIDEKTGIKLILPCEQFPLDRLHENVSYIKGIDSTIFPKIYSITKITDMLVVEMERVHPVKKMKLPDSVKKWLGEDALAAEKLLENNLEDLTAAINEITKHQLCPEDEWYKECNMINGKIIDFHWFYKKPERYYIESSVSAEELDKIYKNALKRYKARGDNKWKGKIYQGYHFSNGYNMVGYSSDRNLYDSYLKLPFSYMSKTKGAKVLDVGSNEGFFSLQSYIHGAKKVIGLEVTPEDVALANDIKRIANATSINFLKDDAVKYISTSDEQWDVVIMNSVLHQIYKNMVGSHELLKTIASKTKYFVYETPANHPLMNIPLQTIYDNLRKVFTAVRLMYVYNAYSSGYRANFVCYTFG